MQEARTAGSPPGLPSAVPIGVMDALRRGALVLTANQRAARTLRLAFNAAQSHTETTGWNSPSILPLQTWLATLWQQLLVDGGEEKLLLNRSQQHALWAEIIATDPEIPQLRSIDALAELAARAWHLLQLYGSSPQHPDFNAPEFSTPDFNASTDTRAFARWAGNFQRVCARERLLTPAELPLALRTALALGRLTTTAPGLLLVDFDHHPPAHRALLEALHQASDIAGYTVAELQTEAAATSTSLYTAAEAHDELRAAADWARSQLEANPTARIAIVVPELAARKPLLERLFGEQLAPASQPITASTPTPFEFSLGQPLAETGPVSAALDLLAWTLGPLPLESIGNLLLSPFLVVPGELDAAARFDAFELRTAPLLRPEMSLEATLSLLSRSALATHLPQLSARLRSLQHHATPANLEQTYAAHAEHFAALLEHVGWTHTVPADSVVAGIRRRWESSLDELATLDFRPPSATQPSASFALQTLTRIARQTIFAPLSQGAPVQILGPLELGGVPFDALWFLSADDRAWPARPAPHPLLPQRLQRRLGMPGADPQRDQALAQTLTHRIAHAAAEVVFSYAQRSEDSDRQPSPLLRDLALTAAAFEPSSHEVNPQPYERILDLTDLPPLPDAVIRGGERVLKDQAACAFRAFAEHRLWSRALDSRNPGLDPRDRGSLVHRILETFWNEVHDQSALRALPQSQRNAQLDAAIDLALERPGRQIRSAWDAAYLDVERERLRMLLRPWLDLELERPPFRVQQQEQRMGNIALAGLRLDLRVDRVDDTAAGPLILDYKTGAASPSDWLSDRPDAPQLPLYAVFNPADTLGGVAFALLRAGNDLCMKGFSDHPSAVLQGKPAAMPRTLADQREEWFRVITGLASAFASGDTRVEPKKYPGTCQFCAQRILCRLDPTSLDASATSLATNPATSIEDEQASIADV